MSAMGAISEFKKFPGYQGDMDVADEVLIRLNIDVDEGTDVSYYDATVLALTCRALAEELHKIRTQPAEPVPAQPLRDVLAEVNGRKVSFVSTLHLNDQTRLDDLRDDYSDMMREYDATCADDEEG